jgi:hypothetical protein
MDNMVINEKVTEARHLPIMYEDRLTVLDNTYTFSLLFDAISPINDDENAKAMKIGCSPVIAQLVESK